MGFAFKISSLNLQRINRLQEPIVFCVDESKIKAYIQDFKIVSINGILSKELMNSKDEKNSFAVEKAFNTILNRLEGPLLIKDFQILFNPEYEIDILKLFIMASRNKRIFILWCGEYKEGKLQFAEPGFSDYKSYKISDCEISCVI